MSLIGSILQILRVVRLDFKSVLLDRYLPYFFEPVLHHTRIWNRLLSIYNSWCSRKNVAVIQTTLDIHEDMSSFSLAIFVKILQFYKGNIIIKSAFIHTWIIWITPSVSIRDKMRNSRNVALLNSLKISSSFADSFSPWIWTTSAWNLKFELFFLKEPIKLYEVFW